MTLKPKSVWLITGCSSGFGRELAREALDRGYRVAVTARRPETVADLTEGRGDQALALALDITDPEQCRAAVAAVQERFGGLDVLVNNAGVGYFSTVEEGDLDAARGLFETNFFSVARLIQLALPGMRARGDGWIVNIGSIGGIAPFTPTSYYAATKHAVEGLTRVLRQEVGPLGIKVMCVEPGGFRTEFSNREVLNVRPTEFADYQPTAGRVMGIVSARARNQPGDPVRGARIIVEALESETPPQNLTLGAQAYNAIHAVASTLLKEMEAWKETSLAADYPENERQAPPPQMLSGDGG
jgi:NAD(P)-dependent dehydrogenase (short-subunit alcohol dehydrogenase family)